jgi:signal transduction histidine kinase
MQARELGSELDKGFNKEINKTDRSQRRVAAVVGTLSAMKHRSGTVAEVAHDARNMVTALALYCDLLAEPGVLNEGYGHYADELRLVAVASRRLVEKLMIIDLSQGPSTEPLIASRSLPPNRLLAGTAIPAGGAVSILPGGPIRNLQSELLANRNLLDALSGLAIALGVRTEGGARPVRLSAADLTRILVNLVKNAAGAMRMAGSIEITLRDMPDTLGEATTVALIVEDSGPGIPEELLETIFEVGFTTHTQTAEQVQDGWAVTHHGLGLSIARSAIEAAGGRIYAANRPQGGACFTIELPVCSQ